MEWVSRPLDLVEKYFAEDKLDDIPMFFKSLCRDNIPLLNVTSQDYLPPNGSLVRYRGMIQDQFDPEFYLKVFSAVNRDSEDKILCHGMYKDDVELPDGFEADYESQDNITGERQTLYVIPIPGETPWVQQINERSQKGDGCGQGDSRSHDTSCTKRQLEDDDEIVMDVNMEGDITTHVNKKYKDSAAVSNEDIPSSSSLISFQHPLPNEKRIPCLVKVYRDADIGPVNGLIEFVGILSTDPSLVNFETSDPNIDLVDPFASESLAERRSRCPPPSLIPRLHCLVTTPLSHSNPLLPLTIPPTNSFGDLGYDIKRCHDSILDVLTGACLGDHLAAEFLLLHLISSVYGRTEVMALGKLSLNISHCSAGFPMALYELIQHLVTKSHCLSLSLSNLNSSQFIPYKDYTDNKLHTGLLQLSNGTHLVVDELAMTPGQLNEKGVANLTALGGVVQWQKVKYDFKFHSQDFNCDLPILVLSEGKSILNVDCHVPLQPMTSSFQSFINEISSHLLDQLRVYLTLCRTLTYHLQPDIQKRLEEDFVQMRRTDPQMNGDMFHHLLCLAQLVTLSRGENTLSLEHWEYTKRLHINRTARLNN